MKAIVFHMNHLQQRKELEYNRVGRVGAEVPATVDVTVDMNYSSIIKKSNRCSSTDIESDNSIGRLVCMACGEELQWNRE